MIEIGLKHISELTVTGQILLLHDVRGRTLGIEFSLHKVHVGGNVLKELAITTAEIVQTRLAVLVANEAILRTLAVTGKLELTLPALPGERVLLDVSKGLLPFAIHQACQRLLMDIS